jgi:AraC-like DNA-binding protein
MTEPDGVARSRAPGGMLHPRAGAAKYRLTRYPPAPDLAGLVQRYWVAEWDLRDQEPYAQETIPHPCVNLILMPGQSRVFGVVSARYTTPLAGQGRVFGVKLRPGACYPLLGAPVSRLTDRSIAVSELFGPDGESLGDMVLAEPHDAGMVAIAERFLRQRLPPPDPNVALVGRVADLIAAERSIVRVEEIAGRFGLATRTLQRLFSQYVGVSPKWVIRNCRLREAADHLAGAATEGSVDWAQLALELGYFDQSHFINDFKAVIGATPAAYLRRL